MKKTLLLIAGKGKNQQAIKQGLRKEGYNVNSENTGNNGLYKLLSAPVNAVLIDRDLPDMAGFEVARTIRVNKGFIHLTNVPIIELDYIGGGLKYFNGYVKIPYDCIDLNKLLKKVLKD